MATVCLTGTCMIHNPFRPAAPLKLTTQTHRLTHAQQPSHRGTHVRAARLPSVDGMLPLSRLLFNAKYLQDTRRVTLTLSTTHIRPHTHTTHTEQTHTPPQSHTPRHATTTPQCTHNRLLRSPSVDGMQPESWLLFESNKLQDPRTAITSHHGFQRCPSIRQIAVREHNLKHQ
jgi:hypothetical protein